MKELSTTEQQYAYLAAGLAAAVCVLFLVRSLDERAALAVSGLGLATAALLAAAARRRHRLSTGVGAGLLAFGPSPAWMVGLPYLMLFGWFTLKAARLRARQEPEVDESGQIVMRPSAKAARSPRGSRRPGRRARRDDRDGMTAVPGAAGDRKPPTASKRYTPPQRPR